MNAEEAGMRSTVRDVMYLMNRYIHEAWVLRCRKIDFAYGNPGKPEFTPEEINEIEEICRERRFTVENDDAKCLLKITW